MDWSLDLLLHVLRILCVLEEGFHVRLVEHLLSIQTWRLLRLCLSLTRCCCCLRCWAQTNLYWQLPPDITSAFATNTCRDKPRVSPQNQVCQIVLSLVGRYGCIDTHPCKAKRGSRELPHDIWRSVPSITFVISSQKTCHAFFLAAHRGGNTVCATCHHLDRVVSGEDLGM